MLHFHQDPLFVWDGEASSAPAVSKKRKQPDESNDEDSDDDDEEHEEDEDEVEDGAQGSKSFDELFAARAQETARQFTVPKSLMQMYVEVDLKLRLATLGALLRGKVEHRYFQLFTEHSHCQSFSLSC